MFGEVGTIEKQKSFFVWFKNKLFSICLTRRKAILDVSSKGVDIVAIQFIYLQVLIQNSLKFNR
jgi:hypothetical protein